MTFFNNQTATKTTLVESEIKTPKEKVQLCSIPKEYLNDAGEEINKISLFVSNLRCGACIAAINRGFTKFNSVIDIEANVSTRRVEVFWNTKKISMEAILQRFSELGYPAQPLTDIDNRKLHRDQRERRQALKRLLVAGLGTMQVMMYAVALYAGWFQGMDSVFQNLFHGISLLVTTPVVLYSGWPFLINAWQDCLQRRLGMDVPIALAIIIAYSTSIWSTLNQGDWVYFDSVTMFIFFLTLGRFTEMNARHRAARAVENFTQLVPLTTIKLVPVELADEHIETDADVFKTQKKLENVKNSCISQETENTEYQQQFQQLRVAVASLKLGDKLLIQPGATIPVDGIVISGKSQVDESMLTGESLPIAKEIGAKLTGGSVNHHGILQMQVTAVGEATALSQLTRMLSAAQQYKPRFTKLVDKIASYFVATVLLFAVVVATYWWQQDPQQALEIGLTLLIVTCPCALSLATPAALVATTGRLAQLGYLVVRGDILERLHKINFLLFDKTGTLTKGCFSIQKVICQANISESECLKIAAALEAFSEHPLAVPFSKYHTELPVTDIEIIPSKGLKGSINGECYCIGSLDFVADFCHQVISIPVAANQATGTWIALANRKQLLALLQLEDPLRKDAQATLDALHKLGLKIAIASGDQTTTVAGIAAQLSVENYQGGLSAQQKLSSIQQLQQQGYHVMMVGDGINDAPVLAAANVSCAMGQGTALAQTNADSVLLGEGLQPLLFAFQFSNRMLCIIKQNIFWAIGYNISVLPLAAMGLMTPWLAAIGMSTSSLIVVLNALRLQRE